MVKYACSMGCHQKIVKVMCVVIWFSLPFSRLERIGCGGQVVGIADGDMIIVLRDARAQVKIRLYGIDASESGQSHAPLALEPMLKELEAKLLAMSRQAPGVFYAVRSSMLFDGESGLTHHELLQGLRWGTGFETPQRSARNGIF